MITGVTLTCPHCGARYRVRIDLSKLRHVRSRARCSSCAATFDVAEAMGRVPEGSSGHPTPAQGVRSPSFTPARGIRSLTPTSGLARFATPSGGIPRVSTPAPFPAAGRRTPPPTRTSKTPVGMPAPSEEPKRPTPSSGTGVPVFSLPAPKAKPGLLKLSDLPGEVALEEPPEPIEPITASEMDAPVMPASTVAWLERALLPLDELVAEPSEGERALDRLL